jgi:hypothetical protein
LRINTLLSGVICYFRLPSCVNVNVAWKPNLIIHINSGYNE